MNDDFLKFFPHSSGKPKRLADNASLLRFVTLTKGIHLFESQTLHFTRLDKFEDEDKFEGLWTDCDKTEWAKYKGFDVVAFTKIFRETVGINCWSKLDERINLTEMWGKYAPNNQGIALEVNGTVMCDQIKAGLSKIKADFCNIVMAEVDYIDRSIHSNLESLKADEPLCNSTLPYYQKDLKFSFENEVRVLLVAGLNGKIQMGIEEFGVDIPIKTSELIQRVWLPPKLADYEKSVFHMLFDKYGVDVNETKLD